LVAALLVVGAIAYLPALGGVFTFDDYHWILENPHLGDVTTYGWQRRPVTLLTFAANLFAHGPQPLGFHLVNIGLHLANAVLVFILVRHVLPARPGRQWAAAAGAALFLLHPAQTEAVTYVAGRATSLMTFWLLVAHLSALRIPNGRRWVALSMTAFALAVGAKEVALIYPVLLTAWYAVGGRPFGMSVRAALPHWIATLCLVVAMGLHTGYRSLAAEAIDGGRVAASPLARLENRLGLGFCFNYGAPRSDSCVATRLEGVSGLTRVLVFPWTTNLDHGRRAVRGVDVAIAAIAAGAIVAGLRSATVSTAVGSVWIVAALLPTGLLVVRSDPVADRLLYLPMVGIAIAASGAVLSAMGRVPPSSVAASGAVVLLALAALTSARNVQYRSEVAIWEDAVRKAPHNPRARVNLAYAYELRDDLDAAEREYKEASRLSPGLRWADAGLRAVRDRRVSLRRRH
jgi:hypothetical protein